MIDHKPVVPDVAVVNSFSTRKNWSGPAKAVKQGFLKYLKLLLWICVWNLAPVELSKPLKMALVVATPDIAPVPFNFH
jgi:hypothetical protein